MKHNKFFFGLKVALFALVLSAGCVVGFLIFARPTVSEKENRTLTPFPTFSVRAFLNGQYTGQISTWYADTFPGRDALMSANQAMQNLYGFRDQAFGSSNIGEEIPTDETFVWRPSDEPDTDMTETETETTDTQPPELPTDESGDVSGEVVPGYYVNGMYGYELFYFKSDNAIKYATAVVNIAHRLDGLAKVYDIVVPLSYCFDLSEDLRTSLGASDGPAAIGYIYSAVNSMGAQAGLSDPIVTIDLCPTVRAHGGEYLYFRTDHHSAINAYYTSRVFLDTVGRDYPALEDYRPLEIPGFVGSIYRHSQVQKLKDNPDTIYAYAPTSVTTVTIHTREGDVLTEPLVDDQAGSRFASGSLYRCFVNGDYPLYEVHNAALTDDSAILIIKESYGNAFIPMLVDSYQHVYAIDYRFYDGSVTDFVAEHHIDTVLFLNNLDATADDYTIRMITSLANRK